MIQVSRYNQQTYYLNPFLIETVESTPDTVITLVNGKKLLVKESADVVVERMREFYQSLHPYSLPSQIYSESMKCEECD
jgi:flagellar protein FlbD